MSKLSVSTALAGAVVLLCTTSAVAQELSSAPERPSADAFLSQNAGDWVVRPAAITGNPTFVYGDRLSLPTAPRTPAAFEAAARQVVDMHDELFGFDSSELRHRRTKHLELSRIGSNDKVAVVFDQVVDGIEVLNGSVTILFDEASGDVLALDTTGQPGAGAAAGRDAIPYDRALAIADAAYAAEFGFASASVDAADVMVIGPHPFFGLKNPIQGRGATLAWVFELSTPGLFKDDLPAQARIYVSAEGDGEVFRIEPTAFHIDGQVTGNCNIGPEPNSTTNQEVPALQNLWVRNGSSIGNVLATTDVNGLYNTGTSGPTNLFFELRGPYCNVNNQAGADATLTIPGATGSNNDPLFNPTKGQFTTAEVAGFYWVNTFREWVVAVDPGDSTMDFSVTTNVNLNDTCNAYFDGGSINMFRTGGNCLNTSYSDVVLHEEGHYANQQYQGGFGMSGAFHEGNADAWAYSINDNSCLDSFFTGGGCLRSALQTSVKKCAVDGDESCNGGAVHTEGQALASAIWRARDNLNQTHGNAAGDFIANTLFLAWMNAYNDKTIVNVILDHWLVLDDNDGNINNGTPNITDIREGFEAYGWPKPPDVSLSVTSAPASNGAVPHGEPVTIVANATSLLGTITTVSIDYSVSGGPTSTVAMTPTGNPNEYAGTIPGAPSPASIAWNVDATSSAANSAASPQDVYHVGVVTILQSFKFDGPTDQGWTHVSLGGQNGDQWHRANPAGSNEATDPTAAFSPAQVWGTDLSVPGWDGMYEPNSSGELRSPTFNLSGVSNVHLQYRRWLAVEEAQYDQAQIRVNGQLVWQNPTSGHLIDTAWELHDLDISAMAANNPSVQVAYRLTSDGGLEFGGWNIDDFTLYTIEASPAGSFTNYGAGCAGTSGTPTISGSGTVLSNRNVTLNVAGGLPNAAGLLLIGTAQANVGVGGGCSLLVGGLIGSGVSLPLDGSGALQLVGTIPSGTPAGDVFMQFFAADAGTATGFSATGGLKMTLP
ncbi:MAG: hypothetical protein ACF8XB_15645 [Planctomycetota bacterium JB042]